jgi:sialidase-1
VGPTDPATKKFRFTCTSPEKSGVLIDDLSLIKPAKMRLLSVETNQKVSPVVIGKDSPVLQINIKVDGNLEPFDVTSLAINTKGTDRLSDIEQLKLFYTANKAAFSTARRFGQARKPAGKLSFNDKVRLVGGDNYFWVSCNLKKTAGLLRRVDAGCDSVTVGSKKVKPEISSPAITKRIGIVLRDSGDDGSKGYRIPGLATTNKGTLIAVYDIRYNDMRDLPGHIDIGMSRSSDKGQTWEPMKVIMDMGQPHGQNGIGDPALLVDRTTNTIWVAAIWSHGNRGWHGSGPGMTPEKTGQFMLVKSDDDGKTWSKTINITQQIKEPKWYFLLQGPGKGITLRDGTLVFPAQFKDENNMPHSTMIYSSDHGKTWTIGTGSKPNTTEAQIVELNNGSLMLNMRDNRGGSRSVYVTDDLGNTWTEHPTTRSALPEPVCMASLIRFASTKDGDDSDILLFSNPATKRGRTHISIKASTDEGMTWPEKNHMLIHEPACAGYSCMTKIDDSTVGILYEGGNTALLIFEKIDINEILRN